MVKEGSFMTHYKKYIPKYLPSFIIGCQRIFGSAVRFVAADHYGRVIVEGVRNGRLDACCPTAG